jgi:SagB-type dehydrogenase family enzyme
VKNDLVVLDANSLRRLRATPELLALLTSFGDANGKRASDTPSQLEAAVTKLLNLGFLEEVDNLGRACRGSSEYWLPAELAVHRRSNRGGFRENELKASGELAPSGLCGSNEVGVALPAPARVAGALTEVLSKRRSVRRYGRGGVSSSELSAVLYHSARVAEVGTHPLLGEQVLRPFASGGARGEVEVYVVANCVDGIDRGVYHFDARRHTLAARRRVDANQRALNAWLQVAAAGQPNRDPPVILILTAVFARVMWKYRGNALAVIYKNVGSLIQTVYLVATAVGLAPCAIGGGREFETAEWLGIDPIQESLVGYVLLGPTA